MSMKEINKANATKATIDNVYAIHTNKNTSNMFQIQFDNYLIFVLMFKNFFFN